MGGSCYPQMQMQQQQPMCQPVCGSGYQCGPYGCAKVRARARSANLFKPKLAYEEPKLPFPNFYLQSPNQLFMECCEERQLPDVCLQKCTFNTFTKDALINMYFKRDPCPIAAAAEIQYCAAQGKDHRDCCVRNGVGTTLAGGRCLVFCDQRPGNVTQLDFSYVSCYDRFDSIKSCFWHDIMARNSFRRFLRHF
ncbi:unnamed protein product [Thelazia callipaeda]|uniref:DB domain-containing protein n=1 Tax=Thelazia callipaeda TaxID=103827 RepID=A0A0N5DBY3_THECL|nr:unnamed protein product [Thelazia callipaeda]